MLYANMPPETPTRRRNDVLDSSSDFDHNSINNISSNSSIINNNNNNNNTNNNNNNSLFKLNLNVATLSSQNSLTMLEGHSSSISQSYLAPPSLYSRERRLSSSSLSDSTPTSTPKRRARRNSTSRLSDFDDGGNDVTLLSFARSAQATYRKARKSLRRAINTLFVSRPSKPNIVCEAEVVEQTSWICKDYVVHKLAFKDLMSRKVGFTPSNWPKSILIINAGSALEMKYPRTYSNVSRKLCMTMSSPKIVRTSLTLLLDVLFEKVITWGKIVSMFVVAGLFAEECASQGHADFAKEVVDVVVDYSGAKLLPWLVAQGGWDAFPIPEGDEKNPLSKLRVLILLSVAGGTAAVVGATFFDWW